MNLGAAEILVILVVALLVFGPQKLPEIGRQVGGAMRELRKMQDSVKHELKTVLDEEQPSYPKPQSAPLPAAAIEPLPVSGAEPAAADHDGSGAELDHADHAPRSFPAAPPRDGFDGPTGSFS
jgi:sec-independent protein translocase protein TatA